MSTQTVFVAALFFCLCQPHSSAASAEELPGRSGSQWTPALEWSLPNASDSGNPYDLAATVTFRHDASGEEHTTGMFFDGDAAWSFRFAGARPGRWTFESHSDDPELDGRTGVVTIEPNDDAFGFVTHVGNKWARQHGRDGTLRPFIPQLVMYGHPATFHDRPDLIERDIETFINGHGFTGFHVPVMCRWFDIEHDSSNDIASRDPNPDPRTFEALELLITKVHAAGGMVHLWVWGDEQRGQTPIAWGINGAADRRLQRYIAARLGPLPGWTMGYGFDLWEWVGEDQMVEWHTSMHEHLGWPHLLGGRTHQHGRPLEDLFTNRLDYIGFETHRPDYATCVDALRRHPDKPVFMEDRFRIRQSEQYADKDYTEEMTRRGLWHSAMAGGVANIWGRLEGDLSVNMGAAASLPYPHPEWIRTNAEFFRRRFTADMRPAPELSDGPCLATGDGRQYLAYREESVELRLDLSGAGRELSGVAVDAKRTYREIDLGRLPPREFVWTAPYVSDWAIAVGEFDE